MSQLTFVGPDNAPAHSSHHVPGPFGMEMMGYLQESATGTYVVFPKKSDFALVMYMWLAHAGGLISVFKDSNDSETWRVPAVMAHEMWTMPGERRRTEDGALQQVRVGRTWTSLEDLLAQINAFRATIA